MKLIRMETSHLDYPREGIYQIADDYVLEDYAVEATCLPIGRKRIYDICEDVCFWFTPKGWEKYGIYLLNLVTEPEAWKKLKQEDIHIYIGTVELEDFYNHYDCDEFQVCLPIAECDGWWDAFEELNPSNIDEVCNRLKIKKGW